MSQSSKEKQWLFDESHWPIVVMEANTERGIENAIFFTESLDKILARATPFALVMVFDYASAGKSDPQASNHLMKWIKPNRPVISQYCRGLVTVSSSQEYHDKYGAMVVTMGQQIYGCPALLVHTMDEALAWAKNQL